MRFLVREGTEVKGPNVVAGGTYLLNDVMDVESDRRHPTKRFRPIASGQVPVTLALVLAPVFIAAAVLLGLWRNWQFGLVVGLFAKDGPLSGGPWSAVLAWRGDFPAREDFNPQAIALILGGFAALIAIIGLGGGFIPATAILFASTATAFGRRAIVTDLVIGLVLGVLVFLLFDKLLTLSLPAGPIERFL